MIRLMLRYRIGPLTARRLKRLLTSIDADGISFSTKDGHGFSDATVTAIRRLDREWK